MTDRPQTFMDAIGGPITFLCPTCERDYVMVVDDGQPAMPWTCDAGDWTGEISFDFDISADDRPRPVVTLTFRKEATNDQDRTRQGRA